MSQYDTSPRRAEASTRGSSPSRSGTGKRKGSPIKSGKKDKEIKYNYYDPHAYDDPHQYYQWYKDKVLEDLTGKAKARGLGASDFESSYMTEAYMSPYTGGMQNNADYYT